MKVSLRLTVCLLGLGEIRLAQSAIRHGFSYRRRGKLSLFQECLHQARGHARYRHNRPTFLRHYACPKCGFHHITSQPLRE